MPSSLVLADNSLLQVPLCPNQGKTGSSHLLPYLLLLPKLSSPSLLQEFKVSGCILHAPRELAAMEPPRKSNYLVALVFASFLLSAVAGGHITKLLNKDDASESMETSKSMQEDDEMAVVVHERILSQVKMNDYGRSDPSPTMAKPRSKDIPN